MAKDSGPSIEEYRRMARDAYEAPSNGLIRVEEDAEAALYEAGAIVQAWVWIADPDAAARGKDIEGFMAKF